MIEDRLDLHLRPGFVEEHRLIQSSPAPTIMADIEKTPQEAPVDQPIFKKRGGKNSNIRKRPITPPPVASDESGYTSSSDEQGPHAKRRRKFAGVTTTSVTGAKTDVEDLATSKFAADRSGEIQSTNDATKQSNWFDESTEDGLNSRKALGTTRAKSGTSNEVENDGTYKGASNYQTFIQKNPNAPSRQVGPIKAPTNIRTITVTDFAPDVCKDYKQTGFCGFGDSCKFLHAREDYKQGWELDKDWEVGTKGKRHGGGAKNAPSNEDAGSDDDDAALEGIPFACVICKKAYTNPIITKCGHYFCEKCALQRYRKNPSCAACGAGTGGVFNGAKGLKKLLDKKRERAKQRRERAIANGEEIDEDSDQATNDEL